MQCPHCEYKHGWDADKLQSIDGNHGDFYCMADAMYQRRLYEDKHIKDLYACPKCGIAFIEV